MDLGCCNAVSSSLDQNMCSLNEMEIHNVHGLNVCEVDTYPDKNHTHDTCVSIDEHDQDALIHGPMWIQDEDDVTAGLNTWPYIGDDGSGGADGAGEAPGFEDNPFGVLSPIDVFLQSERHTHRVAPAAMAAYRVAIMYTESKQELTTADTSTCPSKMLDHMHCTDQLRVLRECFQSITDIYVNYADKDVRVRFKDDAKSYSHTEMFDCPVQVDDHVSKPTHPPTPTPTPTQRQARLHWRPSPLGMCTLCVRPIHWPMTGVSPWS